MTGSPTQSRLVASHNPPELRGTRPCPSRSPDGPLSHPPGLTGPALRAGPSKGVTRSNNGGQLLTAHAADEHRDCCSPLLRQPQGLAPRSLPDPQQRPAGPGPGPLIPNSTHRPGDTQNPPFWATRTAGLIGHKQRQLAGSRATAAASDHHVPRSTFLNVSEPPITHGSGHLRSDGRLRTDPLVLCGWAEGSPSHLAARCSPERMSGFAAERFVRSRHAAPVSRFRFCPDVRRTATWRSGSPA